MERLLNWLGVAAPEDDASLVARVGRAAARVREVARTALSRGTRRICAQLWSHYEDIDLPTCLSGFAPDTPPEEVARLDEAAKATAEPFVALVEVGAIALPEENPTN